MVIIINAMKIVKKKDFVLLAVIVKMKRFKKIMKQNMEILLILKE